MFNFHSSFSQTPRIDSLLQVLKTIKEDTSKINTINFLCIEFGQRGDYDKTMEYVNAGIALIPTQKERKENVDGVWFQKALAQFYNITGIIHKAKGNYSQAIDFFLKSLKLREEVMMMHPDDVRNKKGIADSYNNIGLIHRDQGDYDRAIDFFLKSLKIREEVWSANPNDVGNKKGIAASYGNIGLIHYSKKNYTQAINFQFKSLRINEEIEDKNGMAGTYNYIGNIYYSKGDYDQAIKFYLKSIKIKEEIGDKNGLAYASNNLGNLYLDQGKVSEAKKEFFKSLRIAKEIKERPVMIEVYLSLAACDSAIGNFKSAYEYHKLYSETKDSLLNEESSKQIAEMQTKYDTEKKEQQITLLNKDKELQDAQLNRQKIIIWSVVAGLLVVLILSIFIFRERRKSEKLLLNILPAETANELKAEGKAKAKHYESVTVMFTDFKGFTSISEKLSAEELVNELDFLFKKFDEVISKYNIEKIKTIGDAYMCASGLPTPNENHAENIVLASLEIQQWMINQNGKWQLRIGIHSGPVTAGVVGDKKFAYDIWGDTVNTASRMESSGEAGKINISGATHELIKEKFNCEFRGKIPAKNKGEIEMYFVERVN